MRNFSIDMTDLYILSIVLHTGIPGLPWFREFPLPLKKIAFLLSHVPNIQFLGVLSIGTDFPDELLHSSFPHLSAVTYRASPHICASLSAFINRHPNLTRLELYRAKDVIQPQLHPLYVPNLHQYSRPAFFVPSLVSDTKSFRNLIINWF